MAQLTEDLLDVSSLQRGQLPLRLQRVDISELVRDLTDQYSQTSDQHQVEAEITEGLAVHADPNRLEQVLENLFTNAFKYSPAGGTVLVRVQPRGEAVAVDVVDQGIGLAPEELDRIFEPFGRAAAASAMHVPGMGLGLFLSRGLMERQGGQLTVSSAGKDQGSTFTMWLPRDDSPILEKSSH
jgi:two-component system CheB/CheR fusion protein